MIPGDKAYYPGTNILINRFDIRNPAMARALEYKFASARELELREKPIKGNFDFAHLQAIHKHLFLDMYEWAGKTRELDFAKRHPGTGMVCQFTPVADIRAKIDDLNAFIAGKKQLKGLTKPAFIKLLTELHTKLNELHPFREGNGRATRLFLSQLAEQAGFKLDLTRIDQDRWNMASHVALTRRDPKNPQDVRIGLQGDMRQIFHESVQPTMAHTFVVEPRESAIKIFPELKAAYARLDAITAHASKLPDRDAGTRLVEAERSRIVQKLQGLEEAPVAPTATAAVNRIRSIKDRLLSVNVSGREFLSAANVGHTDALMDEEESNTSAMR